MIRHLPGLFGAFYWSSYSPIIRVCVPALCIVLFISHPVGSQAYAYSFFWFIPLCMYALKTRSLFAEALGSTFVVHAVGSVIWLYTVPMTAAQWWMLIPVVMVERLVFAGLQVTVVYAYRAGCSLWSTSNLKNNILNHYRARVKST